VRARRHTVIVLARRLRAAVSRSRRHVAAITAHRRRLPFNLRDQDAAEWHARAETAVALLTDATAGAPGPGEILRIADLGCGNMRLRGLIADRLGRAHRYRGYDLLPQDPAVERIDLSRELPATEFDVAFCLGILEYLDDLPGFLARLRGRCRLAVLSYAVADAADVTSTHARRAWGWHSDDTGDEFGRELERQGLRVCAYAPVDDGSTGVWLVEPSSRPASDGARPARSATRPSTPRLCATVARAVRHRRRALAARGDHRSTGRGPGRAGSS
jgi:hypothetical protein